MTQPSHPNNEFDQAIADTSEELSEIAQGLLDSDEVKEALGDESRDDAW